MNAKLAESVETKNSFRFRFWHVDDGCLSHFLLVPRLRCNCHHHKAINLTLSPTSI